MDPCSPEDIALKTFFLGPQGENSTWTIEQIIHIFDDWVQWRQKIFPNDGFAISSADKQSSSFISKQSIIQQQITLLTKRYDQEIPTFSPHYMGHMFSELSLPALLGHWIALLHNPNNVVSESSRVGIQIEKEAIDDLITMVGWDPTNAIGHFTSGGSIANLEALFRAREWMTKFTGQASGILMVPKNRHYSWLKGAKIMGIAESSIWQIELDNSGRLDPVDLENKLALAKKKNQIPMMIVSVMGTTEFGTIDPINEVSDMIQAHFQGEFKPWHHVDAAYGGLLCSIGEPYQSLLKHADSVTLDPHKLMYVPYACGAFLCKERVKYWSTRTDASYLNHQSDLERGLFTIEGSRPATGATATWLSSRCIGFNPEGLGRILTKTIQAKLRLTEILKSEIPDAYCIENGNSNILGLIIAKKNERLSETNQRTLKLYNYFSPQNPKASFLISKTTLKTEDYSKLIHHTLGQWNGIQDVDNLTVLRFCLMNPFLSSKELEIDFFSLVSKELKQFVYS